MQLYEPQEDSLLLMKHIKTYANGNVLDVGTGSGILAVEAKKYARFVLGVDIQQEVVQYCKEKYAGVKNLFFKQSDLLQNVNRKFEFIVFNPPYLPADKHVKDVTLDGGKHGYELIERFLKDVNRVLKDNGKILLLFSSLSKKEKIDEFIWKNCLTAQVLEKCYVGGFETLYVYVLEKSPLLQKLEKKKITDVHYFSKGKRGIVFTGKYRGRIVVVKTVHPESKAINRIENEVAFLKRLEKYHIAPRVFFKGEDFFVMELIAGEFLIEYLQKSSAKEVRVVLKKILEIMYLLDTLGINKGEMTRPLKHVLVRSDGEVTVLDFERATMSEAPQNVTQFCQFLTSRGLQRILTENGIAFDKTEFVNMTQNYKKDTSKRNFDRIVRKVYK